MNDHPPPAPRPWLPIPNACSIVLLVLLGTNYFVPFGDLDYTWQIRIGSEIVHTGDLRPVDSFSYTIPGERPPDFEWLYEVVLWSVWSVFGYGGLKLLKTLLVLGPMLIVAWHLRQQGVRWHGIALALGVAVLALTPTWNLRAFNCSTMGLLLVTSWLHDHCTGRQPLPWALPLVMLLWANLHPGVIMGQGLLAGAIGWECLNRWLKWNTPLADGALRRLTILGGLGLAATFLSPDPLERLAYPFKPELRHPIMRIFVEMQPLYKAIRGAAAGGHRGVCGGGAGGADHRATVSRLSVLGSGITGRPGRAGQRGAARLARLAVGDAAVECAAPRSAVAPGGGQTAATAGGGAAGAARLLLQTRLQQSVVALSGVLAAIRVGAADGGVVDAAVVLEYAGAGGSHLADQSRGRN